jgi:hypothetical protein
VDCVLILAEQIWILDFGCDVEKCPCGFSINIGMEKL